MSRILQTIFKNFENEPDKVFLCSKEDKFTGKRLLELVNGVQTQFIESGLTAEDTILVCGGRGNQFWLEFLALWSLGVTVIPVDSTTDQRLFDAIKFKAEPTGVIGDLTNVDLSKEGIKNVAIPTQTSKAGSPEIKFDNNEKLGLILFTSGSTGLPKGVPLKFTELFYNVRGTSEILKFNPNDKLFMNIPFRFVSAISHFLVTLFSNATLYTVEDQCLKADFLQRLIDSQCNLSGGSPVQARWVSETLNELPQVYSGLLSSGDHLAEDVISTIHETRKDFRVTVMYGLTELAGRFCVNRNAESCASFGSVGVPIPEMSVKVLDEDNNELPTGEVGRIVASGICMFSGYLKDDEINQRVFSDQGFDTGDMGYKDENGFIFHNGRSDDVFKSGGLKVSVLPIIEALFETEFFDDVAVVAVRHNEKSRVPHVFYVMKEGVEFKKGKVLNPLRKKLPGNHIPHGFTAVERIPRTGSGKVKRAELRKLVENN